MVTENMQLYDCPSLAVRGILVNSHLVSSMAVLISIPFSWLVSKIYRFTPNTCMLKGIGIGLLIMVLQDFAYIALTSMVIHGRHPM